MLQPVWVLWDVREAQTVTQERGWTERVRPNANNRLSERRVHRPAQPVCGHFAASEAFLLGGVGQELFWNPLGST